MSYAVMPDPKLDSLVAKAIGLRWCDVDGTDGGGGVRVSAREMERVFHRSFDELGDDVAFGWSPSCCIDYAVECADLVGLFSAYSMRKFGADWKLVPNGSAPHLFAPSHHQLAKAICHAIVAYVNKETLS